MSAPTITGDYTTGIFPENATVRANFTDGGESTTVTVFYGQTDGATTAGSWAYSVSLGVCATGALAQILSTGIVPGKWYYVRWRAVNGTATVWSTVTDPTVYRIFNGFPSARLCNAFTKSRLNSQQVLGHVTRSAKTGSPYCPPNLLRRSPGLSASDPIINVYGCHDFSADFDFAINSHGPFGDADLVVDQTYDTTDPTSRTFSRATTVYLGFNPWSFSFMSGAGLPVGLAGASLPTDPWICKRGAWDLSLSYSVDGGGTHSVLVQATVYRFWNDHTFEPGTGLEVSTLYNASLASGGTANFRCVLQRGCWFSVGAFVTFSSPRVYTSPPGHIGDLTISGAIK